MHEACCPHVGTDCPILDGNWHAIDGASALGRYYFCAHDTVSPEEKQACARDAQSLLERFAQAAPMLSAAQSERGRLVAAETCRLSLLTLSFAGPLDEKGKASAETIRRACCSEKRQSRLCGK
jgi:hypothetical protein